MKTAKLTVDKLIKALAAYNKRIGRKNVACTLHIYDDGSGYVLVKGNSDWRSGFNNPEACLKLLGAK